MKTFFGVGALAAILAVVAVACSTTNGDVSAPAAPRSDAEGSDLAVETAVRFMEARDVSDADATLDLLSPDAEILDFGFWLRTADEVPGLYEWMEILEWSWHLEECTATSPGEPVRVTCTHLMENAWSRALGVDPIFSEIHFVIADGQIVEYTNDLNPEWRPVFVSWLEWLDANHPSDIVVMYRHDENGALSGGPATTPDALDLVRSHLPNYVADTAEPLLPASVAEQLREP